MDQEQMEVTITTGICKIQAIADVMRAFYPENDKSFSGQNMPELMRRYGEVIRTVADDLLRQLDL